MLQHVANETRREDVDAVVAFWELLGFARVEPPPTLRERAVWVQRRGTQVHLLLTGDPVVPPAGHAAVVVDDYEAALEALRAAGHPVERRTEHWGVPRAVATDPSGHRVEVMSAPPPPG
jgi:catechol 2,3-dioxygenase-like lactoylglutathione lyase family enzyme